MLCAAPARRLFSSSQRQKTRAERLRERNLKVLQWGVAVVVGMTGMSYASVPLYRMFCQITGFGGTTQRAAAEASGGAEADVAKKSTLFSSLGISSGLVTPLDELEPVEDAVPIKVGFSADVSAKLPWKFSACQRVVEVVPGESALAFFKAKNISSEPIIGVATYNVTPMKAGVYFSKIQCFCFEEQRLEPGEEVDMPVLFYIDPAFLRDPLMDDIKSITLHYSFFKSADIDMDPAAEQTVRR